MRLSRRILAAWPAALLAAALCLAASFAPLPALAEEAVASGEAVAPASEVEQAMNQVPAEEGMFALLYADDTLVLRAATPPTLRAASSRRLMRLTIDGAACRLVWGQR